MPIEEYLRTIVAPMLSAPEKLIVIVSHDDMGVLLTITVSAEDMGVVIGKGGENAKAIRQLAFIVGMRQKSRVHIRITEPDGRLYTPPAHQHSLQALNDK